MLQYYVNLYNYGNNSIIAELQSIWNLLAIKKLRFYSFTTKAAAVKTIIKRVFSI